MTSARRIPGIETDRADLAARRDLTLVDPELFEDPARRGVPWLVRWPLRLIGATWFLRMRIAPGEGSG